MGLLNDLKGAWTTGYETGKANTEKQQRWKKEEMEYKDCADKLSAITLEKIVNGLSIVDLVISTRQVDLQIKYGNNSEENDKNLRIMRKDLRNQIDELRKKKNVNSGNDDNEYTDFVDRYNAYRNKRVALCINYMAHSKATERGYKTALKILLMSPYCKNRIEVRNDYVNLKERISIYKQALCKEEKLSVLDICFYNHLIIDTELIPVDDKYLSEQWWSKTTEYIMTCENTMRYNDEMLGTHFTRLDFYKLSMYYSKQIAQKEDDILTEIHGLYLANVEKTE